MPYVYSFRVGDSGRSPVRAVPANKPAGTRSSDSAIEDNMHDDSPAWLIYERCVAAFVSDQHGSIDTIVQPNVILQGAISGAARQVDVLVDHRWHAGSASRIIVDAKNRSRPLDLGDVEQFEGMMRDCRATRGIIVCTAGWSEAAARRAQQAITITLLDYETALDEYGWVYEECLGPCGQGGSKRVHRGGVLWGEFMAEGLGGGFAASHTDAPMLAGWTVIQIGKCDGCHSFHVWCWDCGKKFAVEDGTVVQCGCESREWASVPESRQSGHVGEPESIWLMMREDGGHPVAFDRRPIR
jgi:hypothetical protein